MHTGLRQVPSIPEAPGHLDSGPGLQLGPASAQFSSTEMRDVADETTEGARGTPCPCPNFGLERLRADGGAVGSGAPAALPPAALLSERDSGIDSSRATLGFLPAGGGPSGESWGGVPLGRVGILAYPGIGAGTTGESSIMRDSASAKSLFGELNSKSSSATSPGCG